jgi:hypothetical protein
VIWRDEKGDTYTAAYYPDGTSAWIYKGDKANFPTATPPSMPRQIGKWVPKFKTASTNPAQEKPGKTSGGDKGKETKTGSGKGKSKRAVEKGKRGTASATRNSGVANVVGTGLAIGMAIAGAHHVDHGAIRHGDEIGRARDAGLHFEGLHGIGIGGGMRF